MTRVLVAFDFDGTLSDSEMTVLLGEQRGVAKEMREITDRAMNDEIGYAESLRTRVGLLSGLSRSEVDDAFDAVRLRSGAAVVLEELDATPIVRTAILTGGFDRGVERALARETVSVDRIVANRLLVGDDGLTGEVDGPLIEGTKDDALAALANEFDVSPEAIIAVGDGANDVPMLRAAGLAIGFQPKPAVRPHCDVVVDDMDELRSLLADEIATRASD